MHEFLPHTADVQFIVSSKTLERLFGEAALAMRETICDSEVSGKINKKIKVKGHDLMDLLHNFLEEILFIMDTENLIFSNVKTMKIENKKELIAEIGFDKNKGYEIHLEIKAVTYSEMYIEKKKNFWEAKVTLDV